MNKHEVVEYVKKKINEQEDEILNEVGKNVAYWVLTMEKYDVDYSDTTPYDYSGEIHKVGERLNKNNYDTLGGFLEEYTGNRSATYCSGCGWSYDNYEKELEYIVRPLIYTIIDECFQELKITNPQSINEMTGMTIGEDEEEQIYESFDDYIYCENVDALAYIEDWKTISFNDIFKRGEFAAKRQLQEELKEIEFRRIKDTEYRSIAEELFKKYIYLCKEKIELIASTNPKYTGHQFWKREDVSTYLDKIVYNEIKDILNENFTRKELAVLSRYKLITTNSVTFILEDGINLYDKSDDV